jgi:hypothetical protein
MMPPANWLGMGRRIWHFFLYFIPSIQIPLPNYSAYPSGLPFLWTVFLLLLLPSANGIRLQPINKYINLLPRCRSPLPVNVFVVVRPIFPSIFILLWLSFSLDHFRPPQAASLYGRRGTGIRKNRAPNSISRNSRSSQSQLGPQRVNDVVDSFHVLEMDGKAGWICGLQILKVHDGPWVLFLSSFFGLPFANYVQSEQNYCFCYIQYRF